MAVDTNETLVPLELARQIVVESCAVGPTERVDLDAAVGSVCAERIVSSEDVPPFANSAVDGYAVRSIDTKGARPGAPVVLEVVGEIAAGSRATRPVGPGQAIKIMTGAPIPDGADGVIMVERTSPSTRSGRDDADADLDRVDLFAEVVSGAAIRAAGDDVRRGDVVFESGTLISPMVAGVLASVNARSPLVYKMPRVAVLSTGDELVEDGSDLEPGQIRESNRTMLRGLIGRTGVIAVDYGIVRDEESHLEDVLRTAAVECDAIVTSGGVSMGDYDVVKAVLGRIAEMRWMQIAIKPAKPFAFGRLGVGDRRIPVFGLPGNPVSSMVSFELLARPALRKMAGFPQDQWDLPRVRALAGRSLERARDGKVHVVRVSARFDSDGRVHVEPVRAQGSHQLAASALANALAILPDGEGVEAGGEVDVLLLLS